MFWAYGDLTKLERLCIMSFVRHGYFVNLWTYGLLKNAPKGVLLRDAREILPETHVFKNKTGSYASFSDWFRYKLLNEVGGLYADTDVIALVGPEIFTGPMLVTERQEGDSNISIQNNIIFNPTPQKGNLVDLAYHVADRFPHEKILHAEIGPMLISLLSITQPEHGYQLMHPDFANPMDYWNCPEYLLTVGMVLPAATRFVHCYGSCWSRKGYDRDMHYPEGSLMARFEEQFGLASE